MYEAVIVDFTSQQGCICNKFQRSGPLCLHWHCKKLDCPPAPMTDGSYCDFNPSVVNEVWFKLSKSQCTLSVNLGLSCNFCLLLNFDPIIPLFYRLPQNCPGLAGDKLWSHGVTMRLFGPPRCQSRLFPVLLLAVS